MKEKEIVRGKQRLRQRKQLPRTEPRKPRKQEGEEQSQGRGREHTFVNVVYAILVKFEGARARFYANATEISTKSCNFSDSSKAVRIRHVIEAVHSKSNSQQKFVADAVGFREQSSCSNGYAISELLTIAYRYPYLQ